MIGLEFIILMFNEKRKDIAEKIEVSPATIQDWIKSRRPIPKKRLKQLSEYFNLPEVYFQKELKPSEKIELQRIKLAREITYIEYEDYIVDDEGNVHEVMNVISPEAEIDNFLEQEQRVEKVLEDVEHMLKGLPERGDEFLRLFESILTILDTEDYPKKKMLFDTVEFLVNYHLYQFGFWTDEEKEPLYIKLLEKYEK